MNMCFCTWTHVFVQIVKSKFQSKLVAPEVNLFMKHLPSDQLSFTAMVLCKAHHKHCWYIASGSLSLAQAQASVLILLDRCTLSSYQMLPRCNNRSGLNICVCPQLNQQHLPRAHLTLIFGTDWKGWCALTVNFQRAKTYHRLCPTASCASNRNLP